MTVRSRLRRLAGAASAMALLVVPAAALADTDWGAARWVPAAAGHAVWRDAWDQVIATDGQRMTVLLRRGPTIKQSELLIQRHTAAATTSTDGGRTWSAPRVLTTRSGADHSRLAASRDGRRIVAVWQHLPKDYSQRRAATIMVSKSTNSGRTWSAPVRLSSKSGYARWPIVAAAADARKVAVAWVQGRRQGVLLARSTDGGASFRDPVRISSAQHRKHKLAGLTMSRSGLRLAVAWEQSFSRQADDFYWAHVRCSGDGGRTWGADRRLGRIVFSRGWPGGAQSIAASADGRRVVTVWAVLDSSDPHLRYARSTDGGLTWSSRGLAPFDHQPSAPSVGMSASGSEVTIAWRAVADDAVPRDVSGVLAARSFDGGRTWQPRRILAPLAEPEVAVSDAGQPTVAWRHYRNGLQTVTGTAGQDVWGSVRSFGRESKPILRVSAGGTLLLTSTPSGQSGVRSRIGVP